MTKKDMFGISPDNIDIEADYVSVKSHADVIQRVLSMSEDESDKHMADFEKKQNDLLASRISYFDPKMIRVSCMGHTLSNKN